MTFTMRFPIWGCFVGRDCGHFGRFVLWLGPVYVSVGTET